MVVYIYALAMIWEGIDSIVQTYLMFINVHLSGNNVNRVKKKKRKTIIRKRSRPIAFGIAVIMSIEHLFFVIVSLLELFLFKNKVLKQAVLLPSSLVTILSEIFHVSETVVLSNSSYSTTKKRIHSYAHSKKKHDEKDSNTR